MLSSLSDRHRELLRSICDTYCPKLEPQPGDNRAFFENAADDHPLVPRLEHHLSLLEPSEMAIVKRFLDRLSSRFYGMLVSGRPLGFDHWTLTQRERLIKRKLAGSDRSIRWLLRSIQRLSLQGSYVSRGKNGQPHPTTRRMYESIGYAVDNQQVPMAEPLVVAKPNAGQRRMACDYLVVGSGAGGAVMAAELAETGKSVLLVDSGRLVPRSELGQSEATSISELYQMFGTVDLGRNEVLITTARTFGGGPVGNWGTCLNPPQRLLAHWAKAFGFHDALSEDFQHSLYTVRRRLEVSAETSRLNRQNRLLKEGLEQLQMETMVLERNAVDCAGCDRCEMGCASGARRDTRQTYLMDAQRLGVYLLPQCEIVKLNMSGKVAQSATALLSSEDRGKVEVEIQFRNVVICAGAIQTPAILWRSEIRPPLLGKNLHLQPAAIVVGDFEEPVEGWHGPVQTIGCDQLSDLDGQGHGVWLETAPVHPGLAALYLPWNNARDHKRWMQRLPYLSSALVLNRDTSAGTVTVNSQGRPIVSYSLNSMDKSHLQTGIRFAMAALQGAGARQIFPPCWQTPGLSGEGLSVEEFKEKLIGKYGDARNMPDLKLFSAHQMSSCRLAVTATLGVVDPSGRVFGTKNVYVADGSVLPTATGVNPMLTITTVSHFLAQRIKALT